MALENYVELEDLKPGLQKEIREIKDYLRENGPSNYEDITKDLLETNFEKLNFNKRLHLAVEIKEIKTCQSYPGAEFIYYVDENPPAKIPLNDTLRIK
ncbi:MAG: hypothetical protein ACOCUU_03180 [Nanoarchaeota archaeon]